MAAASDARPRVTAEKMLYLLRFGATGKGFMPKTMQQHLEALGSRGIHAITIVHGAVESRREVASAIVSALAEDDSIPNTLLKSGSAFPPRDPGLAPKAGIELALVTDSATNTSVAIMVPITSEGVDREMDAWVQSCCMFLASTVVAVHDGVLARDPITRTVVTVGKLTKSIPEGGKEAYKAVKAALKVRAQRGQPKVKKPLFLLVTRSNKRTVTEKHLIDLLTSGMDSLTSSSRVSDPFSEALVANLGPLDFDEASKSRFTTEIIRITNTILPRIEPGPMARVPTSAFNAEWLNYIMMTLMHSQLKRFTPPDKLRPKATRARAGSARSLKTKTAHSRSDHTGAGGAAAALSSTGSSSDTVAVTGGGRGRSASLGHAGSMAADSSSSLGSAASNDFDGDDAGGGDAAGGALGVSPGVFASRREGTDERFGGHHLKTSTDLAASPISASASASASGSASGTGHRVHKMQDRQAGAVTSATYTTGGHRGPVRVQVGSHASVRPQAATAAATTATVDGSGASVEATLTKERDAAIAQLEEAAATTTRLTEERDALIAELRDTTALFHDKSNEAEALTRQIDDDRHALRTSEDARIKAVDAVERLQRELEETSRHEEPSLRSNNRITELNEKLGRMSVANERLRSELKDAEDTVESLQEQLRTAKSHQDGYGDSSASGSGRSVSKEEEEEAAASRHTSTSRAREGQEADSSLTVAAIESLVDHRVHEAVEAKFDQGAQAIAREVAAILRSTQIPDRA